MKVLAVLAVTTLVASLGLPLFGQEAPVPPINTTSRQAVVDGYRTYFLPSERVDAVWTGTLNPPVPGSTSEVFRQATLRRLNWIRAMAGLSGTVVFDPTLNQKCQAAALMISSAKAFPPYTGAPTTWPAYSADGAEGCRNSSLGLYSSGATSVNLYATDFDLQSVGHRLYLLIPGLTRSGTGDIPDSADVAGANALWTTGPYGPLGTVSVAWPAAGYFPVRASAPVDEGFPRYWSFFRGLSDFTTAAVTVRKNGGVVATQITQRYDTNSFTFGDGLVWTLPGDVVTVGDLYEVTVGPVMEDGQPRTFTYTVKTFDPDASKLINVSTRLRVETGDNVGIAGFVVQGDQPRRVVVRALGPSLTNAGVAGALSNPTLVLRDATNQIVAENDDWQSEVPMARGATPLAISDTGLAPTNSREAAVALTLQPGAYTAVVTGVSGEMGVALVEVYDLDPNNVESRAVNVSTRGRVQSGDNVMIGGFVVSGGTSSRNVVVRALGPSLAAVGVTGTLQDPVLEVVDSRGQRVALVDDYDPAAAAALGGLKPTDSREAAVKLTLAPGAYTAIVRGKNGAAGVALVEAYEVQ